MTPDRTLFPGCPIPLGESDRIVLAHGEGMRLTRRLIRDIILPAFENPFLKPLADAATLPAVEQGLVVSTDGFVVSPLIFPGGDIGRLAVHGTVNDLTAAGAEPLYLTVGLILEEGLPLEVLRLIVNSLGDAARECGITVVAGDTKVVPRGAADGMFITATGIGRCRSGIQVGTHRVRPGDRIVLTGTIADHGIAVLAAREDLGFLPPPRSDSSPLHRLIASVWDREFDVHFLRDPTRGGVSAVLHEVCEATGLTCVVEESLLPLTGPTRAACELLGLDPIYVANEGKMLLIVPGESVESVVTLLRQNPLGTHAVAIGRVIEDRPSRVLIETRMGVRRVLDEPSGAPLPRIC